MHALVFKLLAEVLDEKLVQGLGVMTRYPDTCVYKRDRISLSTRFILTENSYPLLQVTQDNLDGKDERSHKALTGMPVRVAQLLES